MTISTIAKLEDYLAKQLLSPQGYAQYGSGDVSKSELIPFVTELRKISQAYLAHEVGARLSSPINSTTAAEAYALYYTIINAAKIAHLLPLMSFNSSSISRTSSRLSSLIGLLRYRVASTRIPSVPSE